MALQLKVTPAGRAAIVNLPNTGTNAVVVTQIGVTATAFDPNTLPASLPGELKRLSTFGGIAVSDDTIHVTLRDDSTDSYSMRGFALYLADGTLFAMYGQTEVILEKSTQAMLLLSADVKFADIAATSIEFGDANFVNPPASTTVAGVTQHATNAEALTGTAANRSIVASALKYVLDSRFGTGAPSAFVKGLLTLATAAAIRLALEIKGAALKDEGAGNGLDADKLDGQHGSFYQAWANLTGVPTTFPPAAHSTAWADITGVPVYATRWPAWGEVTDKPTTFTPSAHSHVATDIVSGTFANARVAVGNVTQHQGSLSISWSQLTGVPGTFPPDAHTHATLTNGTYLTGGNYNGGAATTWAVDADTAPTASKIVARDASGDIQARLMRSTYSSTNATVNFIMTQVGNGASTDNFIRPSTPAQVKSALAIAIADVASLQTTLNAKVATDNPTMTGSLTHTCNGTTDVVTINTPGSSPAGSYVMFTSPGSAPGIVARYSTTKRRDVAFSNTGIAFGISAGTGAPSYSVVMTEGGAVTATGGFQNGSSLALKKDLRANPRGLAEVERIETRVGRYRRAFNRDGRDRLFVIAEQLREVVPEAVFDDAVEMDGKTFASVEYMQLVPVLIRAVQELSARVRKLEAAQ